jgi:hypothetical protein
MQTNCLHVSEFEKVKSLVRWGRAQVLQCGEVEDKSSVRCKIVPCLNYVRFIDLEHQEFAQLCRTVVHDVLTAEEKSSIFESICLSDPELMPLQFRTASGVNSKLPFAFSIALPYKEHQLFSHRTGYPLKSELQFEVDRKVQLVGLQHFVSSVNEHVIKANFDSFCFQVRKMISKNCLAAGTSADSFVSNGTELFRPRGMCILHPGTVYSIDIFYPKMLSGVYYTTSALERGKRTSTDNGLTLTWHSDFSCVNITRLEFKLA